MVDLETIMAEIEKFRTDRDWKQFHNLKDMSLSLVLEASEVLEHFQWKSPEEVKDHAREHKDALGEELADVLYWVLLMSHDLGIDVFGALRLKLKANARKYPISKAKGNHSKYNQL